MYGQFENAKQYVEWRRRRRWSMGHGGLQGYAQFLGGGGGDPSAEVSSIIGAETAAMDSAGGDAAFRAIAIGVTTGVVTFLINRWLGKVFT
jgi:hypothetical protein